MDAVVGEIVQIPIRGRDCSIRAYTVVDATDANWVNQWRWHLSGGYVRRSIYPMASRRDVSLHRELLGLSDSETLEVDHIDRNPLNNRRANLRAIPKAANRQNVSGNRVSTSVHRGVSWQASVGRWRARVRVGGEVVELGLFTDEIAAAKAAQEGRVRLLPYSVETSDAHA